MSNYSLTYSKHWELAIVVQKSLLLSQFFILADTFAEKMAYTCMTCQHESTNLEFMENIHLASTIITRILLHHYMLQNTLIIRIHYYKTGNKTTIHTIISKCFSRYICWSKLCKILKDMSTHPVCCLNIGRFSGQRNLPEVKKKSAQFCILSIFPNE